MFECSSTFLSVKLLMTEYHNFRQYTYLLASLLKLSAMLTKTGKRAGWGHEL